MIAGRSSARAATIAIAIYSAATFGADWPAGLASRARGDGAVLTDTRGMTLYTFDNATGDPEIYTGYLLNPKLPFSPWKDMTLGQKVIDQFNVADEKRSEEHTSELQSH